MNTIVTYPNGSMLDHIAWVVPDTKQGVEQIADLTGAQPFLMPEPEPGAYYWSGGLVIGDGPQLLEIIGHNPNYEGQHPFFQLLRSFPEPRLLFWYIALNDFDAFATQADTAGAPLSNVDHFVPPDESFSEYKRGVIGSQFSFVLPNVIQWIRRRKDWSHTPDRSCSMRSFVIEHPDPDALEQRYAQLGIVQPVHKGAQPALRLTLSTPRGLVDLSGVGEPLESLS